MDPPSVTKGGGRLGDRGAALPVGARAGLLFMTGRGLEAVRCGRGQAAAPPPEGHSRLPRPRAFLWGCGLSPRSTPPPVLNDSRKEPGLCSFQLLLCRTRVTWSHRPAEHASRAPCPLLCPSDLGEGTWGAGLIAAPLRPLLCRPLLFQAGGSHRGRVDTGMGVLAPGTAKAQRREVMGSQEAVRGGQTPMTPGEGTLPCLFRMSPSLVPRTGGPCPGEGVRQNRQDSAWSPGPRK